MIIEQIKKYLGSIPPDRDPKKIGLSSIGHCKRQLSFRANGFPMPPLSWKSQAIFDDGDMHHNGIRAQIKAAGINLFNEEEVVYVETPKGRRIAGHIDGLVSLPGLDGGADTVRLFEFKSMGSYAFERLQKGEPIDEAYRAQMSAYLFGLGLEEAIFLAKAKDNANLYETIYKIEKDLIQKKLVALDLALDATDPLMVERDYGTTGKSLKLDWHCGYCPFWRQCWAAEGAYEKEEHKVYIEKEKK